MALTTTEDTIKQKARQFPIHQKEERQAQVEGRGYPKIWHT